MEIITIYNPRRRRVAVQRHQGTPPRRLVIPAGWGMADAELLRAGSGRSWNPRRSPW